MPTVLQPSFTSGEWSPYLEDRVDLEKYRSGCSVLENFILTPYGAVRRRPGTQYISGALSNASASRMIRFQFSANVGYVLEMGPTTISFYKDRAKIVGASVAHPYSAAELREVQVAQINDLVWFVHPLHPPYKLSRTSDTSWTFAEITFVSPPFREENTTDSWTLTANGTTGSGVTLTASQATFEATHVGAYWRVGHFRDVSSVLKGLRGSPSEAGVSGTLAVIGDWEVTTSGSWDGTLSLEKSINGGPWNTIRQWQSSGTRNFTASGTEIDKRALYRFNFTDVGVSGFDDTNPKAVLELATSLHWGVVQVTGYTSATEVTVTVIQDLADTEGTRATEFWAEGSWSDYRGFPRTVTLHEQRLIYGGNASEAQTVWGSDVDAYDTFTQLNNEDSDSFQYTLGSDEYNGIQWLATSPRNLMVGTTGGEWSFSSGSEELLITPTNVRARRESVWGAEHIQAISTSNVILFVEQGARKLRELAYSFEQDGFVSADLAQLSEHLTSGGIKEMAIQRHRDVTLWVVTGDGLLLSLTYDRSQNIVGWAKHTTQGSFESVCVINTGGEEDEMWFCIKRTINGGTVRYIESFYPDMWRLQENQTQDELFHVDCGVTYTAGELGA